MTFLLNITNIRCFRWHNAVSFSS